MEEKPSSSSSRIDGRTIEKNRRIHMKALCSKLHSLVPHDSSREMTSLPDQLHEAANYIKKLQIKVEKMNEEKDNLMGIKKLEINNNPKTKYSNLMGQQRAPQIEVCETGSSLEAILITGVDFQFLFGETIHVIHEESFDVVNAGFSILNDTVFYTIHAQVGERYAKENGASLISVPNCLNLQIGERYAQENGASKIKERLNNMVYGI